MNRRGFLKALLVPVAALAAKRTVAEETKKPIQPLIEQTAEEVWPQTSLTGSYLPEPPYTSVAAITEDCIPTEPWENPAVWSRE